MNNKYLIGSQLLGIKNSKDIDYLVFADTYDHVFKNKTKEDLFIVPLEYMEKRLIFDCNDWEKITLFQYDYRIIKQNFPFHFDVFENKQKIKYEFNKLINKQSYFFNPMTSALNGNLEKFAFYFAYLTFIFVNNDVKLTHKQKQIVQDIHDEKLPKEYIQTLIDLFFNS